MKTHLGLALVVSMLFLISLLSPYLAQSNASENNEVVQNSYGGVIFNIPTIDDPMYLAMDPSNHMLYVASCVGLFELYPSTFSVKAYASFSYSPANVIYDQKYQKLLLVCENGPFSGHPGVAIINTTSLSIISGFSIPGYTFSTVVDPQNGFLYVTGEESSSNSLDYVAAYNPSNESMLWSIKLVSSVLYVSYDPVLNLMVVTGVGLDKIIFLNPLNGRITREIPTNQSLGPVAVDPNTGEIFAVNPESDKVLVLNSVGNSTMSQVTVGPSPTCILYDNVTGYMYVLDSGSDQVSVISPGNLQVIATLNLGRPLEGPGEITSLAMDPLNGNVYVGGKYSISLISGTTLVAQYFPYRGGKYLAYDPQTGDVYVPDGYRGVLVFNPSKGIGVNYVFVGQVNFTYGPITYDTESAVYDPHTNLIYVSEPATGVVAAINPSNGVVVKNISVQIGSAKYSPTFLFYDPQNGYIYTPVVDSSAVVVINPATGESIQWINAIAGFEQMIYDPQNGFLYATYPTGNLVFIINPNNDSMFKNVASYCEPYSLTYDPQNGYIYILNLENPNTSTGSTISVLNPETNKVVKCVALNYSGMPFNGTSIVYDNANGYLYVAGIQNEVIYVLVLNSSNLKVLDEIYAQPIFGKNGKVNPVLDYVNQENDLYLLTSMGMVVFNTPNSTSTSVSSQPPIALYGFLLLLNSFLIPPAS